VFLYLVVVAVLFAVQFLCGTVDHSLALISEAFHTLYDWLSLSTSLFSVFLSRSSPNRIFSYGYDRIELLINFARCSIFIFYSLFLFFEAFENFMEAPEERSFSRVIPIAFIGSAVNIVGVVFFHSHGQVRSESKIKSRVDIDHVILQALGGFSVIISSWLVEWRGWTLADPIAALGIAGMIAVNAYPVWIKTGSVLLQATPEFMRPTLVKCLREAGTLEGVLECHSEHFWTQSPDVFVGTLCVRVRSDANEQLILQQVVSLFSPYISHLTVQIEKNNWAVESHDSDM